MVLNLTNDILNGTTFSKCQFSALEWRHIQQGMIYNNKHLYGIHIFTLIQNIEMCEMKNHTFCIHVMHETHSEEDKVTMHLAN